MRVSNCGLDGAWPPRRFTVNTRHYPSMIRPAQKGNAGIGFPVSRAVDGLLAGRN